MYQILRSLSQQFYETRILVPPQNKQEAGKMEQ